MTEHQRIWLEPAGAPDRCWCEDNQWGDEGVEYVLATSALPSSPTDGASDYDKWQFLNDTIDRCRRDAAEATARAEAAEARIKALEDALSHALDHYDRNTCLHESVHRGGSIWTICDDCGRQWADDKGGFQPHVDPADIAAARSALKDRKP